jgi:hypothetical protein
MSSINDRRYGTYYGYERGVAPLEAIVDMPQLTRQGDYTFDKIKYINQLTLDEGWRKILYKAVSAYDTFEQVNGLLKLFFHMLKTQDRSSYYYLMVVPSICTEYKKDFEGFLTKYIIDDFFLNDKTIINNSFNFVEKVFLEEDYDDYQGEYIDTFSELYGKSELISVYDDGDKNISSSDHQDLFQNWSEDAYIANTKQDEFSIALDDIKTNSTENFEVVDKTHVIPMEEGVLEEVADVNDLLFELEFAKYVSSNVKAPYTPIEGHSFVCSLSFIVKRLCRIDFVYFLQKYYFYEYNVKNGIAIIIFYPLKHPRAQENSWNKIFGMSEKHTVRQFEPHDYECGLRLILILFNMKVKGYLSIIDKDDKLKKPELFFKYVLSTFDIDPIIKGCVDDDFFQENIDLFKSFLEANKEEKSLISKFPFQERVTWRFMCYVLDFFLLREKECFEISAVMLNYGLHRGDLYYNYSELHKIELSPFLNKHRGILFKNSLLQNKFDTFMVFFDKSPWCKNRVIDVKDLFDYGGLNPSKNVYTSSKDAKNIIAGSKLLRYSFSMRSSQDSNPMWWNPFKINEKIGDVPYIFKSNGIYTIWDAYALSACSVDFRVFKNTSPLIYQRFFSVLKIEKVKEDYQWCFKQNFREAFHSGGITNGQVATVCDWCDLRFVKFYLIRNLYSNTGLGLKYLSAHNWSQFILGNDLKGFKDAVLLRFGEGGDG